MANRTFCMVQFLLHVMLLLKKKNVCIICPLLLWSTALLAWQQGLGYFHHCPWALCVGLSNGRNTR